MSLNLVVPELMVLRKQEFAWRDLMTGSFRRMFIKVNIQWNCDHLS